MAKMKWKKLFESHILDRGYNYFCENAVENLRITDNLIRADVAGTEDYEVEISLSDGEINEMYCSCPYAESGWNCKHLAAVLYEWESKVSSSEIQRDDESDDMFLTGHTAAGYKQKADAIKKIVDSANIDVVREFLVSVLAGDDKLLVRFNRLADANTGEKDIQIFKTQIDNIADVYLGRDGFIDYYEAGSFISELEEFYDTDVRQMIDCGQFMSAFELVNYIFVLIGDVDMDDSDGGTGILAERAYDFWLELLTKVSSGEKQEMFQWFITHLNGSIIDYLEEYIEQIIMEEFCEDEYLQKKLLFTEEMIKRSEHEDYEWSRDYYVGIWATRHLSLMELLKFTFDEIESKCRKYWIYSSVRKYYINLCIQSKKYDLALDILDESLLMDQKYKGLVSDYSKLKREIYLLEGNRDAYIGQLWQLVLKDDAGNLDFYRELKQQYTEEEWVEKREEVFKKLPQYLSIEKLYKEEKLYDRLLHCVMERPGLYGVQEYFGVLKKEYPEQILEKYKTEVNRMAVTTGGRRLYCELVGLLRQMQKIKGGSKVVKEIVSNWKVLYKNRPAMMDELNKL